ncbi:hypothetical protein D3C76_1077530 [compost metagenome]
MVADGELTKVDRSHLRHFMDFYRIRADPECWRHRHQFIQLGLEHLSSARRLRKPQNIMLNRPAALPRTSFAISAAPCERVERLLATPVFLQRAHKANGRVEQLRISARACQQKLIILLFAQPKRHLRDAKIAVNVIQCIVHALVVSVAREIPKRRVVREAFTP